MTGEILKVKKEQHESDVMRRKLDSVDRGDLEKVHAEEILSIVYNALDSSINGVIIAGLDGKIVYTNPAFIRMFEYDDSSQVTGKLAAELFADEEIRRFSDVEKSIGMIDGETKEFSVHRRDGSTFFVEVSSTTVLKHNDEVAGRMASFVDISEQKEAEQENRTLTWMMYRSQEMERERIARDLHDSTAQTIHAAKINFLAYKKDSNAYGGKFAVGIEFLDAVSRELREICDDLYPSLLKDHGLEKTIKWLMKNYLEVKGIETVIEINFKEKLSPILEVHLYRIIKELVSNITRHARASKVHLNLNSDNDAIFLEIVDDGVGYNSRDDSTRRGFGIENIRRRVQDCFGTLLIEDGDQGGTRTTIYMSTK